MIILFVHTVFIIIVCSYSCNSFYEQTASFCVQYLDFFTFFFLPPIQWKNNYIWPAVFFLFVFNLSRVSKRQAKRYQTTNNTLIYPASLPIPAISHYRLLDSGFSHSKHFNWNKCQKSVLAAVWREGHWCAQQDFYNPSVWDASFLRGDSSNETYLHWIWETDEKHISDIFSTGCFAFLFWLGGAACVDAMVECIMQTVLMFSPSFTAEFVLKARDQS